VVAQKIEADRLWDQVKVSVVGLLLAWAGPISLRARNADNRIVFSFNTSECKETMQRNKAPLCKLRSPSLTLVLNILTQASYVQFTQWSSWVPVSASTPSLSIKGAISLEPSPTKTVQFISLGVRPLLNDTQYNELYGHVNRLFKLSTFGAIENHANIEHDHREWGQTSGNSDYINQHAKARKGVDRYPMFHIRILPTDDLALPFPEDQFTDAGTNIQTVVDILSAMVIEWLAKHHFRPTSHHEKHKTQKCTPAAPVTLSGLEGTSTTVALLRHPSNAPESPAPPSSSNPNTTATISRKRKRSSRVVPKRPIETSQLSAFTQWSRIKSGKTFSANNVSELSKSDQLGQPMSTHMSQTSSDDNVSVAQLEDTTLVKLKTQPLAQGALNEAERKQVSNCTAIGDDELDNAVLWIEAAAKKTHTLNARTGCMVPLARHGFVTGPTISTPPLPRTYPKAVLRPLPTIRAAEKTQWLNDMLHAWDNPVFKTSEERIKQSFNEEHQHSAQVLHQSKHDRCCYTNKSSLSNALPKITNRLSKDSLLDAEVLAQVDRKFILVKTRQCHGNEVSDDTSKSLLVLIDQHAADERIQVETLFRNLCSPVAAPCSDYHSRLGHSAGVASVFLHRPPRFTISEQERLHFIAYAEKFASWGILFDISEHVFTPDKNRTSTEMDRVLSVIALPPSISERCGADTKLLIHFLRSTVWDYASNPVQSSHVLHSRDQDPPDWVARLADCPKGLLDLINSRACRSAIMFNDELNLNQCKELVQRLASCVFPFVCAHGRPSIVPLVDFGDNGHDLDTDDVRPGADIGGFVKAWKEWHH
jgi:DNA mismatch repair protein MLH3